MDYYNTPSRHQYYSSKNYLMSPATAPSENYSSPKHSINVFKSVRSSLSSMINDIVAKK